ncbi:hypothetical protein T11_15416 [Trichinella zimbabwensis]|uniref:Uncharacterized protein n=1 Tax=Trichinella zimbabwensis TaxID=268475 RepID=A0A0V1I0J4_9BILA|nr:hypothetical protein T11_15416 [Trichinella zimbabwensis]
MMVASSQPNCFEVPFALDTGKCDVSPDGALIWRWRIGVPHWFHCRFAYHKNSGRQCWCPYSSCQRGSASCL